MTPPATPRRLTVALASAAGIAAFAATRSRRIVAGERRLALWLRRPAGGVMDIAVSAGTDLGSTFAVAGAATSLAVSGHRTAALDTVGAGAVAWGTAQGLKWLVNRPRPYQLEIVARLVSVPAGSSWPSGHPAVTAAVATVLAPRLPPGARIAAGGTAVFVAWSRIYVGVHYPADVVAGVALGVLSGRAWLRLRARAEAFRSGPDEREAPTHDGTGAPEELTGDAA